MNALLITYDLNKGGAVGKNRGQNYDALYAKIKELSNGAYWNILDSNWIIHSAYTAHQVRDNLFECVDGNDQLFVVNISHCEAAWKGFKPSEDEWLMNILR